MTAHQKTKTAREGLGRVEHRELGQLCCDGATYARQKNTEEESTALPPQPTNQLLFVHIQHARTNGKQALQQVRREFAMRNLRRSIRDMQGIPQPRKS